MPKKILIIAGEASSDYHAASLVKAINSIRDDINFFGIGGEDMQNAGVNVIYNIIDLAVIGPVDLIKYYNKLRRIYNDLCYRIKQDKPDCAILIDYPGFNLKIAKDLKSQGIPVVYYISPQIWAWGSGRIKKMKHLVDKMLVFFKFEESLYQKEGIDVTFVGHPLLGTVKQTKDRNELISQFRLKPKKVTIGMLPGSRKDEVIRILPIMIKTAKLIQETMGTDNVQFLLPVAKTLEIKLVKDILKEVKSNITIIEEDTYNAISLCKVAMVASGTATLETALLGVPMAIIYKVGLFTYLVAKTVIIIRIPYIGLVNVVAGEKIVPEFIQYGAKPKFIAEYLLRLLKDGNYWQKTKKQLLEIKSKLGAPGASMRAGKEVVDFLTTRCP
ncbi:MAG: lipid-A-disaccharide synthase [Candidatus Omnitrophota bacterium]|nr:MAG: lipid-A-disaccharide synthase [Candidatus Omnitrophota bacterium]